MVEVTLAGTVLKPLLGGIVIGLAVTLMLLLKGRVTGISGIVNGALSYQKGDYLWRWMFMVGLVGGGVIMAKWAPPAVATTSLAGFGTIALAGLIVGFGTVMGSGCTSGHAVCGISRLSIRSITATVVFMAMGFASVFVVRHLLGVSL